MDQTSVCSLDLPIPLGMSDQGKDLSDVQLEASLLDWIISKLLPVFIHRVEGYAEMAYDMVPKKPLDM
jgi:hypothetical protein